MSISQIRKAVRAAEKRRSNFPDGTVIRWTSADRFTYVAVLAATGVWFTTARAGNPFVDQTLTFDELLDILARPESSNVEIAKTWSTP